MVSYETEKVSDETEKVSDETKKVKTESEQIVIEEEKMKSLETLEEEENRLKWLELVWKPLNN